MKNSLIVEKYELFNISKDNQPKFECSNKINNFHKCSILENTDIKYFNSTKYLKKQK